MYAYGDSPDVDRLPSLRGMDMIRDDQRRLDEALSIGFFADRVVDALGSGGPLSPMSQKVLERARDHLEMALGGQKTIAAGKLTSRSAENIHAYTRAMDAAVIVLQNDEEFRKQFTRLLEDALSEVEKALRNREVNPSEVERAHSYFDALRKATIRHSSSFFREEPNAPAWLLAAP